ncbi:MAG: hypothetical protein KDD42_08655, partial [Bdellovibrionales bacterium]|nr:hypothetical protein [Bdellovibrionales bacterium]
TFEAGDEDAEAETALTKEIRAAVEAVIETEDFAPEEFAALITSMTDALEEIDPNIFDEGISTEEEEEGYVASDEDDDDEDYDEDDLDDEDLYDDEDYELDD